MMKTTFIWAGALLFTVACAGGDEGGTETATAETGAPSTPIVTGDNEWGARCGATSPDCPAGQTCTFPPVPAGSTTEGYCSPSCSTDDDCNAGFFGPGRALCFNPPTCLIDCDQAYGEGQCPDGLTCLPTGGPTNACGVPEE